MKRRHLDFRAHSAWTAVADRRADRSSSNRKVTLAHAGTANSEDSKLHLSLGELYLKLGMRNEAHHEFEVFKTS